MTVDHVLREALPWRETATVTECGRPAGKLPTITRSQWHAAAREWNTLVRSWRRAGANRPPGVTPPNICQVCWDTAARWPTWRQDPVRALAREIEQIGYGEREKHRRLRLELLALGQMFAADPGRFAELLDATPRP